MEQWNRKCNVSFNVVNISLTRCEELVTISSCLAIHNRRHKEEINSIYTCINNIIATEHIYVASAAQFFTTSSTVPDYSRLRRARRNVMAYEITQL